jgi:hypothetical protein
MNVNAPLFELIDTVTVSLSKSTIFGSSYVVSKPSIALWLTKGDSNTGNSLATGTVTVKL